MASFCRSNKVLSNKKIKFQTSPRLGNEKPEKLIFRKCRVLRSVADFRYLALIDCKTNSTIVFAIVLYIHVPSFSPPTCPSQKFLGMEYWKVEIPKNLKCTGTLSYRNPAPRGHPNLKLLSFTTGAQGCNILKFQPIPPTRKENRICIRGRYILASYGERVLT